MCFFFISRAYGIFEVGGSRDIRSSNLQRVYIYRYREEVRQSVCINEDMVSAFFSRDTERTFSGLLIQKRKLCNAVGVNA